MLLQNSRIFFFMAERYSLYICTAFSIHSPVAGPLGCLHVLAMVNDAAMNIGCRSLSDVILLPPDTHPEVAGLLDHMVLYF